MQNLTLYIMNTCPFCKKVLRFIEKNSIEGIEVKDIIGNEENEKELIEKGGKKQVPMLMIGDKPMYESDDIIEYLKENMQTQKPESTSPVFCLPTIVEPL